MINSSLYSDSILIKYYSLHPFFTGPQIFFFFFWLEKNTRPQFHFWTSQNVVLFDKSIDIILITFLTYPLFEKSKLFFPLALFEFRLKRLVLENYIFFLYIYIYIRKLGERSWWGSYPSAQAPQEVLEPLGLSLKPPFLFKLNHDLLESMIAACIPASKYYELRT